MKIKWGKRNPVCSQCGSECTGTSRVVKGKRVACGDKCYKALKGGT